MRSQAKAELQSLRAFDQRKIMAAVNANLSRQPFVPTRQRKKLGDVTAEFEHDPPLWELRVGEFRVFYDGKPETLEVCIRAIRSKPPEKTTAEVLR
jgi:mRNA-degrading endonuclease RelE of RelBE toxin-antitoxin system